MSGFELGDDRVDRCTVRPTALSPVHSYNTKSDLPFDPHIRPVKGRLHSNLMCILTIGAKHLVQGYVI